MDDPNSIYVTWDELGTRKVDNRLREVKAMERNRTNARLADSLTADISKNSRRRKTKFNFSNSSILLMSGLGLIGGLLAWAALLFILGFSHATQQQQAREALSALATVDRKAATRQITTQEADEMKAEMRLESSRNPYFTVLDDPALTARQKKSRVAMLDRNASRREFILKTAGFGACGMILSLFLSIAVPLRDRNFVGAIQAAGVGALSGLIGGLLFGAVADSAFVYLAGSANGRDALEILLWNLVARALVWALLGLLLSLGSGLALRNLKRLLMGTAGGILGGLVGGALFQLILQVPTLQGASELLGLLAISLLAGNATAIIENAAKTCWLKATSGPMAGKQFIIYRSPAFIGSAPDCHIFLPKEQKVGHRHAALHMAHGRVEVEDLPLGGETLVNSKPIIRERLRHGDRLQIGATTFSFQEKVSAGSFFMTYMNLFEHMPAKKSQRFEVTYANDTHSNAVGSRGNSIAPKNRPARRDTGPGQWG